MSIFLYQIVPYNSITFMPKIAAIDRMVPEQCMPKLTHHRLQRCYMGVLTVVRGALWHSMPHCFARF